MRPGKIDGEARGKIDGEGPGEGEKLKDDQSGYNVILKSPY